MSLPSFNVPSTALPDTQNPISNLNLDLFDLFYFFMILTYLIN